MSWQAVAALHKHDIVHYDLKCDNIMIEAAHKCGAESFDDSSLDHCLLPNLVKQYWAAHAAANISKLTLTMKLDGNWTSFQSTTRSSKRSVPEASKATIVGFKAV